MATPAAPAPFFPWTALRFLGSPAPARGLAVTGSESDVNTRALRSIRALSHRGPQFVTTIPPETHSPRGARKNLFGALGLARGRTCRTVDGHFRFTHRAQRKVEFGKDGETHTAYEAYAQRLPLCMSMHVRIRACTCTKRTQRCGIHGKDTHTLGTR